MSLTVRSRLPLAAAITPAPPRHRASSSIEASSQVRPRVGPPEAHRNHQPPLTSPLTGSARHLSTTPRASSPTRPTAGYLHRRSVVPGPPRHQGQLHAQIRLPNNAPAHSSPRPGA
ncbi:hypothetical protein NDU88_006385 [Pleurodeles waltl]|uniref:Uncharacterized protein n=1 Tax=Pleurodeles waltl TaxID=8319 RepID=A0AAV7VMM4_PLEWA|nr:hypothetical protein NDU88_006385 [Pleurodeles waltl]